MKNLSYLIATALLLLAASPPSARAAEKKPAALVSAPLSINPNEGQPICLVTNTSAATTIAVTVEIVDAMGTVASASLSLAPGSVDAVTDVFPNFYTFCLIKPDDASQLPLLRGSHCVATGSTARACVEARY